MGWLAYIKRFFRDYKEYKEATSSSGDRFDDFFRGFDRVACFAKKICFRIDNFDPNYPGGLWTHEELLTILNDPVLLAKTVFHNGKRNCEAGAVDQKEFIDGLPVYAP
jgi:hypothetical protein